MPHPILTWLGLAPSRAADAKAASAYRPGQVPPLSGSVAVYLGGRAAWTPRDYAALSREGFQRNAVVHRAVRLVSEAAASIPLTLTSDGTEVGDHPLTRLLAAPNPREAGTRFLEGVYGHLMVSGNAYLQAVCLEGEPRVLYGLRPDRMRVVAGPDGWPVAYDYLVGSQTLRFDQDVEAGPPPILQLTLFHPLDDHYGLSPMEAAAVALDIHNAAGAWNKALLDNAARPSGALVFAGPAGTALSDTQFDRLKAELEANYQGAANAGRPLLLEGGLDWKALSLSPKDMDFVEAKNGAAREIALAFGVPPLLLGLAGDNTHANYAEANRAFYRQTVIPLVRRTAEALIQWLGSPPGSGPRLRLEPDLDAIEALATERESLWRRVGASTFLDDDEKREAVGYGRRDPDRGSFPMSIAPTRRPAAPKAVPETKLLADPALTIARSGEFEGYASLFGVPDLGRDVVVRGAFRDSLARRGAGGIRMLWQHDPVEPIGRWLSLVEDGRGLKVRGRLSPDVARAREIASLMAEGAVDGLSIGFRVVEAARDRSAGLRRLLRIDLWEISVVTFPMLPGARVAAAPPVSRASASLALSIRRAALRLASPVVRSPAPAGRLPARTKRI